jgi:hypothetical protein
VNRFRRRGDELVAEYDLPEAQLLAFGIAQVAGLIEYEPPAGEPADPGLERLFPDGYRDDPDAAAELRAMIEDDLRTEKLEAARTVLATLPAGGEVRLDLEQADQWLRAFNDALLVVSARLGVTAESDLDDDVDEAIEQDPTGPRALALTVRQLLAYQIEYLATALTE